LQLFRCNCLIATVLSLQLFFIATVFHCNCFSLQLFHCNCFIATVSLQLFHFHCFIATVKYIAIVSLQLFRPNVFAEKWPNLT
jgi:hypothetical protein